MALKLGILVVGHGTKSPLGAGEFRQVFDGLAARFKSTPMAYGFLEHAAPTIDDGVELLARKGVTSILIAPLLLFCAGHAKTDIPNDVARAAQERGLRVAGQAEVLGLHPLLVELSLRRFRENGETDTPNPAFVLVGRGGSDFEAQRATAGFVEACRQSAGLSDASHCFMAVAKPGIFQHLAEFGRLGKRSVVVVPHLLFHGDLMQKCEQIVAEMGVRYPQTKWRLADRLGPEDSVVLAAVDRIQAALAANLPKN